MRKKDSGSSTYFRSGDRVFCLNGSWFYQTREDDHGPFASREEAELDLKRYIEEMRFFDSVKPEQAGGKPATEDSDFANFTLVDKE